MLSVSCRWIHTGIVGPRYCRAIERPSHYVGEVMHYVGEVVHRFSDRDRAKGTAAFFMAMAIVYGLLVAQYVPSPKASAKSPANCRTCCCSVRYVALGAEQFTLLISLDI